MSMPIKILSKYEQQFQCRIKIVGGDTDSLFFEVKGVDLHSVLYPQMQKDGLLDTSNYEDAPTILC